MSEVKVKCGDRVRVVLEGEVYSAYANSIAIVGGSDKNFINPKAKHVKSIEVLEPPVEVFAPGTVVRSKQSEDLYTVGELGYLRHRDGHFYRSDVRFTSRNYERVELS